MLDQREESIEETPAEEPQEKKNIGSGDKKRPKIYSYCCTSHEGKYNEWKSFGSKEGEESDGHRMTTLYKV